jgi:pimeloyl-ACP methyl ester carboxylesterase
MPALTRTVHANGIRMRITEEGNGPAVVLCHGFPELGHSWRHQLPALAAAGFHAIAPDQRGYGGTDAPAAVEQYDIHHLTGDLVGLLDTLDVAKAVFVGHDWGGLIVWMMPLLHPTRTAGVVGVNTPYLPRGPMSPITMLRAVFGENYYAVHFQEPGVADAGLARDVRRVFTQLLRRGVPIAEVEAAMARAGRMRNLVEAIAEGEPLGEPLLTDADLQVYVDTFTRTGFTGGLNWYRNLDRNWETTPQLDGARIEVPSLMVTAEWDFVLRPEMAEPMRSYVTDLETVMIPRCGHWTQQEKPGELNQILVRWLAARFR